MRKLVNSLKSKIYEGLEYGDLKRLVRPYIQIDGFKSKMGDDEDIIVLCIKVKEKVPAEDFMTFLENGYEDVLDADVSQGEMDDGSYLVFVEMRRDKDAPQIIMGIVEDTLNLTGQSIEDWTFSYHRDRTKHPLTLENLQRLMVLSPREYRNRFEKKTKKEKSSSQEKSQSERAEINQLKAAAGVPVSSAGPQPPEIQEMQLAAGIPISTH